jgi:lipopolysaccharide/colanic/teichoic acid biosynthesis glycosyltransferase
VRYERKLSSRNQAGLSLVLFQLPRVGRKGEAKELIAGLQKHVRLTDHIGWYDTDRIGLLLPATKREGAESLCHHLVHAHDIGHIPVAIHSYPDEWMQDGSGVSKDEDKDEVPAFTDSSPLWKRIVDIAGSVFMFLLFAPVFLLYPVYVSIVSPGPVFFRQRRVGRGRREFDFIKFRTMHVDNNQATHSHHAKDFINHDKPMTKLDDVDPRIIPGGKIMRMLGLDELPQVFNVLRGEMTLVGPRPCIPYEADEYQRWHRNRFAALPGITGLWQISGKNDLTFRQMIQLDIAYCESMTLRRDLLILLATPRAIARMAWVALQRKRGKRVAVDAYEAEPELRSQA